MTIKIQHKRSAVAGKAPLPADLEYGEIAVNYEATDPALYVKDSADAIRKIGGDATETVKGIVELATAAETTTGTDATRAVHPAGLKSALTFTQTGTGAKPRSYDSKFKDTVSVKDFGAVGDGKADDTAAIQTAVNSGSSLYFPKGTYLISSSITITVPSDIDPLAKFNITSGTFAFGPGTVDCIKPEWFYFSGGYETALSKAFAVQSASLSTVLGMSTYGCVIPVSLGPNKKYVIGGTITGQDYLTLHGNSASIQTASAYPFNQAYPIINSIGYQPTITGVTFAGGNNVLVFPENPQGFDIVISKCRFTEWKGVSILSSPVPHAQHLMVTECEWTPRIIDSCICDIAFDSAIFDQCQYTGPSSTVFINRNSLTLTNWITSPLLPQGGEVHPHSPRWILNEGIALTVEAFRFGGEPGARRILQNNVGPVLQGNATSVSITNCNIYTGGDYSMELLQMPANFIFENNFGFTGGAPIKYSGVDAANLLIGRSKVVIDGDISSTLYGSKSTSDSGSMLQRVAVTMNRDKELGTSTIATSQKILDVTYGSLGGAINPSFTVNNNTDIFGATNQTIIGFNGDSFFDSHAYWEMASALTGQPAGVYTIVVNAQVGLDASFNMAPISFGINGSKVEKHLNLHNGKHTLSLQFYWDGTNNPGVGFSAYNINVGSSFSHNGLRLYFGAVNVHDWNSITYANAAPATGYHRLGDRVVRLTPVVGQPKAWVCTVAGTPGTWVSEGNL